MADNVLVNRNGITYQTNMANLRQLDDEDLILVNRESEIYTMTGSAVKESLGSNGDGFGANIPPYAGYTTMPMNLTVTDGKTELSLDGISFSSTLSLPSKTFYYVRYTDDILTSLQGDEYVMETDVELPDLGTSSIQTTKFFVDKVPDDFSLGEDVAGDGGTVYTTDIFSPLNSINAPTYIWAQSNANDVEINVAGEGWVSCPLVPDPAVYVERGQTLQMRHTTGSTPSTQYLTTLYVGYALAVGAFKSADFSQTTGAKSFNPGTLTDNTGGEIAQEGTTFSLTTAAGININHTGSDWQVASDAAFTTIVDESLDDSSNLLSWTSTAALTVGETYYARGRYIDETGFKSEWAELGPLTCAELYRWKLAVRIKGGKGGKAGFTTSQNLGDGREGGQGTVELIMTNAARTPVGTVQSGNGSNASNASGGTGFQGSNGGTGKQTSDYFAGGGGGGGGFLINSVFVAGVGGSGGNGPRDQSQGVILGGQGASLPSADGGRGNWGETTGQAGYGGTVDEADVTDPTAAPTPGVGQNGRFNSGDSNTGQQSSGAGAGGWGAGESGYTGTNNSGRTQGGGGGASWSREVGFIIDNQWEVTAVNGSYNTTAQNLYRASLADPDNWTSVGTAGHGTRDISSMNPNNRNLIPDNWTQEQRRAAMQELITEYNNAHDESESY